MSDPAAEASEGRVRVVGTAHVSADSVAEVEEVIDEEHPDVVAVELDEGRYRQLKGQTPDDLEASDLLRGNTVFQFLAYWMLSYVQSRLGERFDIQPGAEMLAAVEAAEAQGAEVALVDRDIQVTIQRFWRKLSTLERIRLVGGLALGVADGWTIGLSVGAFVGLFVGVFAEALAGPFLLTVGGSGLVGTLLGLGVVLVEVALFALTGALVLGVVLGLALGNAGEDIEEFDPEELTDADVVTAMMEEFRRFSPGGAKALIDERDAYIAHKLVALRKQGRHVVAVVGAGHREGIERYLDHPEELPPFDSLIGEASGSRFSVYRLFGYLFTLGFLLFFVLLAMAGVRDTFLLQVFAAWFLVNGVFAFALAMLAGAHWQSAAVGGAVAWLTSVNPLLAPGWFAGYVELRYTSVNVSDIGRLNEIVSDEESPIRELYAQMVDVPLFRLIMVVAMTNVGSFIASVLFATVVLPAMFQQVGGVEEITRLMLRGARNSVDLLLRGVV